MATTSRSFTSYLPKKTQDKIKKDEAKFESTFKLTPGTVQQTKQTSSPSSSSKSSSSSSKKPSQTTPQTLLTTTKNGAVPIATVSPSQSYEEEVSLAQPKARTTAIQVKETIQPNTGRLMITPAEAKVKGSTSEGVPYWVQQSSTTNIPQQIREVEYSKPFAPRLTTFDTLRTRGDYELDKAYFSTGQKMFGEGEKQIVREKSLTTKYQRYIDEGEDYDNVVKRYKTESTKLSDDFEARINKQYPDIYKVSQLEARQSFGGLPSSTKFRLNVLSASLSAQKGLIGLGDFQRDVWTKGLTGGQIKLDKSGNIQEPFYRREADIITSIKTSPSIPRLAKITQPILYTKETFGAKLPEVIGTTVVYSPFVISGVAGIKGAYGQYKSGTPLKEIFVEGLASASPVKMADRVYTGNLQPTKFKVKVLEYKYDGVTYQKYKGFDIKNKDLVFEGFQGSTDKLTLGYSKITSPVTRVSLGGLKIETGTLTQPFGQGGIPYGVGKKSTVGSSSKNIKLNLADPKLKSGVSDVISRSYKPFFTYDKGIETVGKSRWFYGKAGGVIQEGKAFDKFKSGAVRSVYESKPDLTEKFFVYQPSSVYRGNVRMEGKIFNLNKFKDISLSLEPVSSSGTSFYKSVSSTSTTSTSGFTTSQVQQSATTFRPATQKPVSTFRPNIQSPMMQQPIITTTTSQSQQSVLIPISEPSVIKSNFKFELPKPSPLPKLRMKTIIQAPVVITADKTISIFDTKTSSSKRSRVIPTYIPSQLNEIDTIQEFRQDTSSLFKRPNPQVNRLVPSILPQFKPTLFTPPKITPRFYKPSPIIPIPFILVKPFGVDRMIGLGDIGSKRKYRYTPSFKALVFNIRGRMPKKKVFTGLEVRPIVKGSFF